MAKGVGDRRSVGLAVRSAVVLWLGGDSGDLARGKKAGKALHGFVTGQVIPADLATDPERAFGDDVIAVLGVCGLETTGMYLEWWRRIDAKSRSLAAGNFLLEWIMATVTASSSSGCESCVIHQACGARDWVSRLLPALQPSASGQHISRRMDLALRWTDIVVGLENCGGRGLIVDPVGVGEQSVLTLLPAAQCWYDKIRFRPHPKRRRSHV